MVNMDKLLDTAIKRGTSDIHLICGIPAMFRIKRQLLPYEEGGVLSEAELKSALASIDVVPTIK